MQPGRLGNRLRVAALATALSIPAFSGVNAHAVDAPPTEFLGVVEVPKIFGTYEQVTASEMDSPPKLRPARIPLRRASSGRSPVVAVVTTADEIDLQQLEHLWSGASVYGRSDGWSLLRLRDGRTGWLSPKESGEFHSFEQLIQEHVEMELGDWDRELATAPGSLDTVKAAHDPRLAVFGYLQTSERMIRTAFEQPTRSATEIPAAELETLRGDSARRLRGSLNVIVFSRRPGWFEVGLHDDRNSYEWRKLKRVWIEDAEDTRRFHPLPDVERFGIGPSAWNGDREESPVAMVKAMRRVGGRLWLQVQILADNDCIRRLEDITDPPIVLGTGWIPAHDPSGQPFVWFQTYCD